MFQPHGYKNLLNHLSTGLDPYLVILQRREIVK